MKQKLKKLNPSCMPSKRTGTVCSDDPIEICSGMRQEMTNQQFTHPTTYIK